MIVRWSSTMPCFSFAQCLASPDSSLCPTLFHTHYRRWPMPFFSSLKLKQTLCCLPVPAQQLRTEIGGRTSVRTSEPGGGRLAAGMRVLDLQRPCLHPPPPPFETETVAKRRRGVVGVATSLFSLHSFFDHLHITPPYTQPPSPTPLSVKERKTDICITSSYCTRFIWNLRVSLERAEEKYFFVEVIFCCLSFFFLSKKKKNSEK